MLIIHSGNNLINIYKKHTIQLKKKYTWWWLVIFSCALVVINSLRPRDAIWQYRSGSTLAQVMAWCRTAPSHYLNQCWLIISKVLWCLCEDNFARETSAINHQNYLENYFSKFLSNLQGANELNLPISFRVTSLALCQWSHPQIYEGLGHESTHN